MGRGGSPDTHNNPSAIGEAFRHQMVVLPEFFQKPHSRGDHSVLQDLPSFVWHPGGGTGSASGDAIVPSPWQFPGAVIRCACPRQVWIARRRRSPRRPGDCPGLSDRRRVPVKWSTTAWRRTPPIAVDLRGSLHQCGLNGSWWSGGCGNVLRVVVRRNSAIP